MRFHILAVETKGEIVIVELHRNRFPFLKAEIKIKEIWRAEKLAQQIHGACQKARHALFERTGDEQLAFGEGPK